MSAQIISGKEISLKFRTRLQDDVNQLIQQGIQPGLAVVLVGSNPASTSYVRAKRRACEELGVYTRDINLPETITESDLLTEITMLNKDNRIHGILVQLPLPPHLSEDIVLSAILPQKDVDGFHALNLGQLLIGKRAFVPCTPLGIVHMLKEQGLTIEGKHAVIVGRSNIVGKPLANLLLQKNELGNATVTVCHSKSQDITKLTVQADILVAAIGSPGVITGEMIRPGAVVIDVGVNRIPDPSKKTGYRLTGDVNFEEACKVASYITPVPGGVGPMTITMLLHNTIESAKILQRSSSALL